MRILLLSFHVADIGVEALGTVSLGEREQAAQRMRDLMARLRAQESFYLATCNRVELAFVFDGQVPEDFSMVSNHQPRIYWGLPAVTKHLLSVALSQDSVVIGETQIMGQFKSAVSDAQKDGLMGPRLNRLTNRVIREAKRIRSELGMSRLHTSVSTVAGKFLLQQMKGTEGALIFVGAGETNQLLARYLSKRGYSNFVWINRTLSRAKLAAKEFGGRVLPFEVLSGSFATELPMASAVVLSTGAGRPLLPKEAVEKIAPRVVIDLSIPANAERAVVESCGAQYWSLDDMTERLRVEKRDHAELLAEMKMAVEVSAERILSEMQSSHVAELLAEAVRQTELAFEKAWQGAESELSQLSQEELEKVRVWSRKTVNQVLHQHLETLKVVAQSDERPAEPSPKPVLTVDQIAEVIQLARHPMGARSSRLN